MWLYSINLIIRLRERITCDGLPRFLLFYLCSSTVYALSNSPLWWCHLTRNRESQNACECMYVCTVCACACVCACVNVCENTRGQWQRKESEMGGEMCARWNDSYGNCVKSKVKVPAETAKGMTWSPLNNKLLMMKKPDHRKIPNMWCSTF